MHDHLKRYTPQQLDDLTRVIEKGLRMSDGDARDYADQILQSGQLALFGFGSLIGDSVGHVVQYRGSVRGWAVGASAVECYFRGTTENIHLTATADRGRDSQHIDGVAQIIWSNASALVTETDIKTLTKILDGYSDRESGPSPTLTATYKFVPVDVYAVNGTSGQAPIKAIICAADEKRPNYMGPLVGDPYDRFMSHGWRRTAETSWTDFAALEALSSGPDYKAPTDTDCGEGHPVRSTGASYWRFLLSNWTKAEIELPDKPHRAVLLMNAIRKAIGQAIDENNPAVPKDIVADYARVVALETRPASLAAAKELSGAAFALPNEFVVTSGQAIALVLEAREKLTTRWHNQLDAYLGGSERPQIARTQAAIPLPRNE